MVDIERVVTLDELMDRVPEQLVRDAESRRVEEEESFRETSESKMSKEPSKAKRIREYLDKHPGSRNKDAVELLMNDPETDAIVMIGEIGGGMEAEAANWIKVTGNKKPVVGFIAGQTAPPGRRMGHAGAIVGGADDTAAAKMKIMAECGIHVVSSPADIGKKMAEIMKK